MNKWQVTTVSIDGKEVYGTYRLINDGIDFSFEFGGFYRKKENAELGAIVKNSPQLSELCSRILPQEDLK